MQDEEIREIWICDQLHITYTQLEEQPAWWVNKYMLYLEGKTKAENLLTKPPKTK
jgi:hypothetical protein